jgi:hypothetical protein
MRYEPLRVFEQPDALEYYLRLDSQMTALAQRQQIPPSTVPGVNVEMMHRQGVAGRGVVRVLTTDAGPAGLGLDLCGELVPVVGVVAFGASWHQGSSSVTGTL